VPCLLLWVLCSAVAVADPAPKPWAAGVSEAEQTTALALYKKANTEFEEARYGQALAMYRDAIKHWDHPAIRFNMVVCLVNLDQPLEAYDDLEAALKYGADPFSSETYAQGLTYKKLLQGQLARLQVTSKEPNAEITLDGAKLFTAPGEATKLAMPGNHQLVATKPGFLTTTIPLVLMGGKTSVLDVTLTHLAPTTIVRRWSPWKPWLAVGGGAALLITGGLLEARSYSNFQTYNREFDAACAHGCGGPTQPAVPDSIDSREHRARIENDAAIAMFVGGGAALIVGAIGVYLNQPHEAVEKPMTVTPVVMPGAAALLVGGSF